MTRFDAPHYERKLHQLVERIITRRTFLVSSMGSLVGLACSPLLSPISGLSSLAAAQSSPLRTIAPLFCTAYLDPTDPRRKGQEAIVARYPLTLVSQDMRTPYVKWRDKVKELNPSIVMLGYQDVNKEAKIPGPGFDKLRELSNVWCVYPDNFTPTVISSKATVRLFDLRKKEWQDKFIEACRATLNSYPYDGLFLDNCTVFPICHPVEEVRAEMRQALQNTLLILRKEFPSQIFVGNSSYHWAGLNGEMNEGRPTAMEELNPFAGHVEPKMQLYFSMLRHSYDIGVVKKEMAQAHSHGALYGAGLWSDYSQILWFDEFDEVLAEFKRASKKQP